MPGCIIMCSSCCALERASGRVYPQWSGDTACGAGSFVFRPMHSRASEKSDLLIPSGHL